MTWNIQDFTPEEEIEAIQDIDSLRASKDIWATSFNLILNLQWDKNLIGGILAKYEREQIIERFNKNFDFLLEQSFILDYTEEEWLAFYREFVKNIKLNEYIDVFDKWLFAKSFVSAMYAHSWPAFESLSEEKQKSYLVLKDKYAPIPLSDFFVVRQIIDKILFLDDQYWYSNIHIKYN